MIYYLSTHVYLYTEKPVFYYKIPIKEKAKFVEIIENQKSKRYLLSMENGFLYTNCQYSYATLMKNVA